MYMLLLYMLLLLGTSKPGVSFLRLLRRNDTQEVQAVREQICKCKYLHSQKAGISKYLPTYEIHVIKIAGSEDRN